MRTIPLQQKMEAIELYLSGFSTNEVVTESQISKGTVVSIIEDARQGRFPGLELKDRIDEFHKLSMKLKKEGLDLPQAKVGFSFLTGLLGMGIEPDKVKEWIAFCSEISPSPPEGFIPAAMGLLHLEKTTGKSYAEITADVKKLTSQRDKLVGEVKDLKANKIKDRELRAELDKNQNIVNRLKADKDKLESTVKNYNSFVEERAEKLGISSEEFSTRLKELVSLEDEVASKRSERAKLTGEIEALIERREKLSSQMEKASTDFGRDINLIRETRDELVAIAELKGRCESEVEDMEWASEIIPFLRYPDKVDDPDFELASTVVGCIDKWLPAQNLGLIPWQLKWGDITRHVKSKRVQSK
jgi:ribosome-binding protein aMBF1 (putative translation factor)